MSNHRTLFSYFDSHTPDIVLKSLFQKYDTDNSGTLTVTELPRFLEDDLGLSRDDADTYALLLDKDASGDISYDEFRSWLRSDEKLKNVDDTSRFAVMRKAVDMFRYYDRDGNGGIDREEFKKLYADLRGTTEHSDVALRELDIDGNGKISFYELLKWLNWIDIGGL